MQLPDLERRYIHPEKISAYLLNVDHPEGGPKACFFMRFGFRPVSPETLHAALMALPTRFEVSEARPTAVGVKYVIDGPLVSPDGRDPWVRTIWRLASGGAP